MPLTDRAPLPRDTNDRDTCAKALTREWGPRYGLNISRIKTFLESLHPEVATEIWHARDDAGMAICNKPQFVRGLLEWANQCRSH